MAGYPLNDDLSAASPAPIEGYLHDIGTRLAGPRRRRVRILSELGDGLGEAAGRHLADGMPVDRAAEAAMAQFGDPATVADAFTDELGIAYARRTIAAYVITGPIVGLWWLLLLRPEPWRAGPTALLAVLPVLPLIAVVIAAAGTTLATTGRLMRWLPETPPRRAITATLVIAGLCMAADLTMIGLFATSSRPVSALAIIAVAASAGRTAGSIAVTRTATRLRRAATRHDPE
jgi:hypothetical protein